MAASTSATKASALVDVEKAVADFLANPALSSLELPHMTTGQRKHAKQVVERHAGLTCESYGFGQERRLHIIKSQACKGQVAECDSKVAKLDRVLDTVNVKVKNTFIDGVIAPEGDEASESVIFRSMPAKLPGGFSQHCLNETRLPAMMQVGIVPSSTTQQGASVSTSASASSAASSLPSTTMSSPETSSRDLHDAKNVQPEQSVDPVIMSTPAAAVTLIVPTQEAEDSIAAGTEVVIEGLVKAPAFNGQCGVVQSFDKETGRYAVLLASKQLAKIKRANFRLVAPSPPPCYARKLWLDVQAPCAGTEVPSTPLWAENYSSQAGAGASQIALTLPLTALV
eukprot:gnl/TRDRNA2_/TRDRNA2_164283_c0_seq5.p1 gnl/TRDRNA2_/TRDRNA2_164283_c0~~gnl/TRDRNA2_/TRDRNA2_164283_c0_seq5.p1  ORF type:complete len:359 (-),score=77.26 gnl/TRDRNA2_/TRDRNA2_164283_c0_seq5:95-1114(-)